MTEVPVVLGEQHLRRRFMDIRFEAIWHFELDVAKRIVVTWQLAKPTARQIGNNVLRIEVSGSEAFLGPNLLAGNGFRNIPGGIDCHGDDGSLEDRRWRGWLSGDHA